MYTGGGAARYEAETHQRNVTKHALYILSYGRLFLIAHSWGPGGPGEGRGCRAGGSTGGSTGSTIPPLLWLSA